MAISPLLLAPLHGGLSAFWVFCHTDLERGAEMIFSVAFQPSPFFALEALHLPSRRLKRKGIVAKMQSVGLEKTVLTRKIWASFTEPVVVLSKGSRSQFLWASLLILAARDSN